jgi:beta-N-acetylhexosaminidase
MRAISATVGVEEGAVRSLVAGADALCLGHDLAEESVESITEAIVEAVRSGRLAEGRLEEAASRVRSTSSWVGGPPRQLETDKDVGIVAARRALRSEGAPALTRTALVVDLEPRPSIAAGTSPGPGEWLRRALPGADVVRLSEGHADAPAANGRQLLIVARDAHRHPWQRSAVEELLAESEDAILLEVGIPQWRPTGAAAYLATYGAARVNLEAAAELLVEKGKAGL